LKVRAHAPAPYQDVLDFAYYSGWRRNEILELTWDEVDLEGGVIRLSPRRSKTKAGRVLPISAPLREVLRRRKRASRAGDPRVFRRDGVPVRTWRTALRDACRKAKVPHRLLHDCRRTAARNLIRASVPERIAMLLTGHKTRAVFDRYNIGNEQEQCTHDIWSSRCVSAGRPSLRPFRTPRVTAQMAISSRRVTMMFSRPRKHEVRYIVGLKLEPLARTLAPALRGRSGPP
jgi:integrase